MFFLFPGKVHDMFNWSAVILLLPIEVASGYLYHLTGIIVDSMDIKSNNYNMEMLNGLTRPFTNIIIEVLYFHFSITIIY